MKRCTDSDSGSANREKVVRTTLATSNEPTRYIRAWHETKPLKRFAVVSCMTCYMVDWSKDMFRCIEQKVWHSYFQAHAMDMLARADSALSAHGASTSTATCPSTFLPQIHIYVREPIQGVPGRHFVGCLKHTEETHADDANGWSKSFLTVRLDGRTVAIQSHRYRKDLGSLDEKTGRICSRSVVVLGIFFRRAARSQRVMCRREVGKRDDILALP